MLTKGLFYIQQLIFCYYDLLIHEKEDTDVVESFDKLPRPVSKKHAFFGVFTIFLHEFTISR